MMHYDSRKVYPIIVNGKSETPIIFNNARRQGRSRDGATLPTKEFLLEYGGEIPMRKHGKKEYKNRVQQ